MKKSKGFTLVELLVILAIIGIIAAVAIPLLLNMQSEAKNSNLDNTITQIELAVEQYKSSGSKTANGFTKLSVEDDGLFISEQEIFLNKAGKGILPGGNLQKEDITDETADFNEVVYSLVRKEAITAVKAFTDLAVIDDNEEPKNNYFIDIEVPEGTAIVYNYLTGKVSLEKVSEMMKTVPVTDGVVNTDAYFVYLTRPFGDGEDSSDNGGGGEITPDNPIDDEDFKGDFYLRVTDWVTGEPISNASVDLYNGIEYREYSTDANGYLILNKTFVYGEYTLTVGAPGYVTYYNDIYKEQHDNANILATKEGYIGDSSVNVYSVALLNAVQGDMSFTKSERTFNKVSESWDTFTSDIKSGIITVKFEPDLSDLSPSKTEEAVTYTVDLSKTDGIVELFTEVDGVKKYLKIGNYIMTVDLETEPAMRTLTKKVTATVFGIDDRPEKQYEDVDEFYTYVQELKTLKTELKGKIDSNMDLGYQPLENLEVYSFWDFNTSGTKEFRTFVELWQGSTKKYSEEINTDGTYSIKGIEDGKYDVYIRNTYCEKFQPSKINYILSAEGYDSTLDMIISESDYTEVDVTFTLKFPDGSPIDTGFKVLKDGVTGLINPVYTGNLVNGKATFKLKPGVYKFTYTKPYAKTESDFYSRVVVTDKGKVVNAIYKQVNTLVNVITKFNDTVITLPTDTGMKLVLTCIDSGNVASPITVSLDGKGAGKASVKPGNYKYTVTFGKHYKNYEGTIALFDKNLNWLTTCNKTLTLKLTYDTNLGKHSALQYESVTGSTHWQHCTLCDYKSPAVICTFNGTRELPTDGNEKNYHYTYCSVCKINKELQSHVFTGAYRAVGTITKSGTGTHYRKCTTCSAYGLGNEKDKVEGCTLSVTSKQSTTHTFTCGLCSNSAAIQHNYNGAYKVVTQATKTVNGTHNRRCYDCDSYGIGNKMNNVQNCTIVTSVTNTASHTRICNVCNLNTYSGNHEWGNYLVVTKKTAFNVGQHNRKCGICDYYEATANCNSVEDTANVTKTTHRYKCTTCQQYVNINHNFNGAYQVIKAGAGGTHNQKCAGCSAYGVGSGATANKDGTEVCSYGAPSGAKANYHTQICSKCNKNYVNTPHTFGGYELDTQKSSDITHWHHRKCTKCNYYEASAECTLELYNTTANQHNYKCSVCAILCTNYHNFNGEYKAVNDGTNTKHNRKCAGCNEYGIGSGETSKKNNVENCTFGSYVSDEIGHTKSCTKCDNELNTAHTWGSYNMVTAKTTIENGTHNKKCSICNYIGSTESCNSVLKSTTNTQHTYNCSQCGNSFIENHSFGNWVITKEATADSKGEQQRTCTICSYVETQELDVIPSLTDEIQWQVAPESVGKTDCTIDKITATNPDPSNSYSKYKMHVLNNTRFTFNTVTVPFKFTQDCYLTVDFSISPSTYVAGGFTLYSYDVENEKWVVEFIISNSGGGNKSSYRIYTNKIYKMHTGVNPNTSGGGSQVTTSFSFKDLSNHTITPITISTAES